MRNTTEEETITQTQKSHKSNKILFILCIYCFACCLIELNGFYIPDFMFLYIIVPLPIRIILSLLSIYYIITYINKLKYRKMILSILGIGILSIFILNNTLVFYLYLSNKTDTNDILIEHSVCGPFVSGHSIIINKNGNIFLKNDQFTNSELLDTGKKLSESDLKYVKALIYGTFRIYIITENKLGWFDYRNTLLICV